MVIMRKLSFILFLAILMASCDSKINTETTKTFVGEYWMKTDKYELYKNGDMGPLPNTIWSPVSIYEENGEFYVQTELFGEPDTISEHQRELEIYVVKHPIEETGIETGEIAPPNNAEKLNTNMWIYHEKRAQPASIQVTSSSSNVLNLRKYQTDPIEVPVFDSYGDLLALMYITFDYKSMVKKNDIITWDVIMNVDEGVNSSVSGSAESYGTMYKNILYMR